MEQLDVCGRPARVNNQFWEYLEFGNGRLRLPGQRGRHRRFFPTQAYARNNTPIQADFPPTPQLISVFITNPEDVGKRILLQGNDQNGLNIYSQDILNNPVQGQFVTFQLPFATAPQQFSAITGVQKDMTAGPIQVFTVDPITGAQVLILTMEPTEETAWYRRYHLDPLPWNCCDGARNPDPTQNQVTCTAIAMLEHIPVKVETDYLLIQERRALTLEAQSHRMSRNESPAAMAQAKAYHQEAVRLLIGQLTRMQGLLSPAIQFKPWGNATLARAGVGRLL